MLYALNLDERSKKVLLVLCALFIILLLIFGGIYVAISAYMKRQSKKMDTYMYDLLKYKIVKNKGQFKKALIYHEKRLTYNTSKWPIRIMILLTAASIAIVYIFFNGDVKAFYQEVFQLIPNMKWPTIKEVNESILDESLKLSGPGWLPASIFPTFISKHPDFSSPLLYCSTIYYICMILCLFKLIKAILAFIARIKRGFKMSNEVFLKNLEKIDLDSVTIYSETINSEVPNQQQYEKKDGIEQW